MGAPRIWQSVCQLSGKHRLQNGGILKHFKISTSLRKFLEVIKLTANLTNLTRFDPAENILQSLFKSSWSAAWLIETSWRQRHIKPHVEISKRLWNMHCHLSASHKIEFDWRHMWSTFYDVVAHYSKFAFGKY